MYILYFLKSVRDRCGDVLVAVYEGEEDVVEEEVPVEVEAPPPPVPRAAPKPASKPTPKPASKPTSGGGGGGSFEVKAKLNGHNKQVSAIAFSTSDPTLLTTGGYDNKV